MPSTVTDNLDPWLPRQLPGQLASLGALYRSALEPGSAEQPASVGWRLHAALLFASRLAPLPRLAELTGLTVEQLATVLVEFADDDASLAAAA
jgi:hypothetical protein